MKRGRSDNDEKFDDGDLFYEMLPVGGGFEENGLSLFQDSPSSSSLSPFQSPLSSPTFSSPTFSSPTSRPLDEKGGARGAFAPLEEAMVFFPAILTTKEDEEKGRQYLEDELLSLLKLFRETRKLNSPDSLTLQSMLIDRSPEFVSLVSSYFQKQLDDYFSVNGRDKKKKIVENINQVLELAISPKFFFAMLEWMQIKMNRSASEEDERKKIVTKYVRQVKLIQHLLRKFINESMTDEQDKKFNTTFDQVELFVEFLRKKFE
jgi:hypothetical protein